MFIKIDYELGFSSICNTENEVIEGCGYEVNEITLEEGQMGDYNAGRLMEKESKGDLREWEIGRKYE